MKKLTARQHILYNSKLYAPGDELPANNSDMVDAWIKAGTAVWMDDSQAEELPEEVISQTEEPSAEAIPQTAEPGLPGTAVASEAEDGENLVGKVPKTASRKKK